MFTGIVEEVGKVIFIRSNTMSLATSMDDIREGDSVMVDGVCLTVTGMSSGEVRMDIGRETIRKTALARLRPGAHVNMERAMRLSDRINGHLVYGHVTEVGKVISVRRSANTRVMNISASRRFLDLLVEKGSVAVNGVSLTVNSITRSYFSVGIIPETVRRTNLGDLSCSSLVNLEPDMLLINAK